MTANPTDKSVAVVPTEEMVGIVLQEFRKQIGIHMSTNHSSASPGHDAMRIALRKAMLAPAAPHADTLAWVEEQIVVLEPMLKLFSESWDVSDHERQARYNVWCIVRDRLQAHGGGKTIVPSGHASKEQERIQTDACSARRAAGEGTPTPRTVKLVADIVAERFGRPLKAALILCEALESELASLRGGEPVESSDKQVVDGIYGEKVDEVLALVAALEAIATLNAGQDEQCKDVRRIALEAICEQRTDGGAASEARRELAELLLTPPSPQGGGNG